MFKITFAPEVMDHLETINRKYHGLIKATIHEQLAFAPSLATRNRKHLHQPAPFGSTWELRFGPDNRFRAFYDLDEAAKIVRILAIGVKTGNSLWIGNEEYKP